MKSVLYNIRACVVDTTITCRYDRYIHRSCNIRSSNRSCMLIARSFSNRPSTRKIEITVPGYSKSTTGGSNNNNDNNGNTNGDSGYSRSEKYKLMSRVLTGVLLLQLVLGTILPKGKRTVRLGKPENAEAIMNVTNDAFVADQFFKKPLYYARFTVNDVTDMFSCDNAVFLILTVDRIKDNYERLLKLPRAPVSSVLSGSKDGSNSDTGSDDEPPADGSNDVSFNNSIGDSGTSDEPLYNDGAVDADGSLLNLDPNRFAFNKAEDIAASVYLEYHIEQTDNDMTLITGKMSAVAVPRKYEHHGFGKRIVQAAEEYLLKQAQIEMKNQNLTPDRITVRMEMGVVSVRTDLFPWYVKQGYTVEGNYPPDRGFEMLLNDDYKSKVHLVKMTKKIVLKPLEG